MGPQASNPRSSRATAREHATDTPRPPPSFDVIDARRNWRRHEIARGVPLLSSGACASREGVPGSARLTLLTLLVHSSALLGPRASLLSVSSQRFRTWRPDGLTISYAHTPRRRMDQSLLPPPAFLPYRRLPVLPSPSTRRREFRCEDESASGDTPLPAPTVAWIWSPAASPARPMLLLLLVVDPARVLPTLRARMVLLLLLLHHRHLAIPAFEGAPAP